MAERNPAPIRIDFVGVETKFLSHRASLRRKRLVAFDDVNVIQIKSRTLEGNRNSLDRPYTHDARFNPGMAPSYDAAHGLEPFLVRSEEHTSELQSLMRISYAVFCLEKTNNTIQHRKN